MSLSDRIAQVRAIADLLWLLPAPARRPVADKLYGLGLRYHPELAELEIQRDGPKELGNHRMAYPVAKQSKAPESEAALMDMLDRLDPEMAAKIREARARDEVLAEMAAIVPKIGEDAAADAQRVQLARKLGFDVPDDFLGAVDDLKSRVDAFADTEAAKAAAERKAAEDAAG